MLHEKKWVMDVQHLVLEGLDKHIVRELYLYKIPVLKTCDNWSAVKEVGMINFRGRHANYLGGLIRYMDTVYFVSQARLDAVAAYRKWKFTGNIDVISEEEWKKKQASQLLKPKKRL